METMPALMDWPCICTLTHWKKDCCENDTKSRSCKIVSMHEVFCNMQEPTKAAAEIHQIMLHKTMHETVVDIPTTMTIDSGMEQKEQYFWNCVHAVSSSSC